MEMTPTHVAELSKAKHILESPGIAAQISNVIGMPVEKGIEYLPAQWSETVKRVSSEALEKALRFALLTLDKTSESASREMWHKVAVFFTGASGGALGLPALAIELPISTTIMLRSIADIARSEGEDLLLPDATLACLEVFAFGGATRQDDAAESGYFAVRMVMAKAVTEAANQIAKTAAILESSPVLLKAIATVANRFGIAVSQKVAAQAIPVIGAATGAIVNLAFIDHFQNMARGHFIVRRLERLYGKEIVQNKYRNR